MSKLMEEYKERLGALTDIADAEKVFQWFERALDELERERNDALARVEMLSMAFFKLSRRSNEDGYKSPIDIRADILSATRAELEAERKKGTPT